MPIITRSSVRWPSIITSTRKRRFPELTKEHQAVILYGSGNEIIEFNFLDPERGSVNKKHHSFEGIIANMERRYHETDSLWCAMNWPNICPKSPVTFAKARGLMCRPEMYLSKTCRYTI